VAVLVAAGIALSAPLRDSGHVEVLVAVGAVALLALCLGVALRWSAAVAAGVALLGAQQGVRLALGPDALDAWSPLYAGSLLLCAELAWWSLEPRVRAWSQPGAVTSRAAAVLLACIGATVLAAFVALAAGASTGGGVALELAGVAAAAAALAVVAYVSRTPVR
jgi:hypothetical protein